MGKTYRNTKQEKVKRAEYIKIRKNKKRKIKCTIGCANYQKK